VFKTSEVDGILTFSEPNNRSIYENLNSKLQVAGNAVGNKFCTSANSEKLLVSLLHFP
jgi:hypothetical protein